MLIGCGDDPTGSNEPTSPNEMCFCEIEADKPICYLVEDYTKIKCEDVSCEESDIIRVGTKDGCTTEDHDKQFDSGSEICFQLNNEYYYITKVIDGDLINRDEYNYCNSTQN